MSRLRDQFIASIAFMKNKPHFLDECIRAAAVWKKSGALDSVEFDQIVEAVEKMRRLNAVMSRTKIVY